jgi:glycosyltransferase involved in cell wall biosynthesis
MRIAMLSMGKDIGGAAQDILTLSKKLSEIGHKVFVVSTPGVLDVELVNTQVEFVNIPLYTRNLWGLWKAGRMIRRFVREREIDILNPQGMYTAFSCWMASLGFRKMKSKTVTTIHMISSMKLYRFASSLNVFSDWIVTESVCERDRLTTHGVRPDRVTVISNSVDMVRFSRDHSRPVLRNEYCVDDTTCCFGIVARLSKEKCHLDFVEAARLTHEVNENTRFFIVGDGPERESIERAVKGAEAFILLTGMRRDIPDVLRSLDCFVLTSDLESLPLSIREAMSMGLPVISTDVGGVREAVLEGVTGLVVPPHDPGRIADAMVRIAGDRALRNAMGSQALETCRANFELGNWARKTEDLFINLLDHSK